MEKELLELLRARDSRGAERLLLHYGPLMRYVISPILADPRDREECLSEVVLRVWEHADQFDPQRGSWNAWLTALTRNTALNRARHNRRFPAGAEVDEQTPSPAPTPEEALLRQERAEEVRRAVAALPKGEQALFYRKYYYLQSTAQIAAELGLSPRAVEGRLYRLRTHLRRALGGDGHG